MKKKCCFIIPYFGKMPNFFQLFLKTCSYNPEYDWIIFTDDNYKYNYPPNVTVRIITFEKIREIVNEKFNFEVALTKPYKLCDLKPAYGYIFEEYIKEYEFWGHCDIDTLIGDLNYFITDELLNKYDKLFCLGHMVLYRNTFENNRIFMNKLDGRLLYKESFSTTNITVFDETYGGNNNIDEIFKRQGKAVLREDWSINFNIFPTKFIRTKFEWHSGHFVNESYKEAIYIWEEGKIYRIYKENHKIIREEFMYMHLQCRNMKYDSTILKEEKFKIVPNAFLPLEVEKINYDTFDKVKKWTINFHYLQVHYKRKKKTLKKIFNKYKILKSRWIL